MPVVNVELLLVAAKKMTFLPQNLEEFTTPESSQALPENMAELRYAMYDKIDYALSLGVFTEQEASDWREGFEACAEIEHMESLVEVIDDFIDSGWAIVSAIEDLLATGEINDGEKTSFLIQMEGMDYQDKIELCRNLEKILNEVSRKKAKLKLILVQSDIARPTAVVLEREFGQANVQEKEQVIKRAEKLKKPEPSVKTNTSLRLCRVLDSQIEVGNARGARQILSEIFPNQLSYSEYVRFDKKITRLEIYQAQLDTKAIYKQAA